jgi:hypothetical protein
MSELQFEKCLAHKVQGIKKALQRLAERHKRPDTILNLTFIVVGKRHHTRFFPKSEVGSHGTRPVQPARCSMNQPNEPYQ